MPSEEAIDAKDEIPVRRVRLGPVAYQALGRAVAICSCSTTALAQTSLPSIDIGKPKTVTHAAAERKPGPRA